MTTYGMGSSDPETIHSDGYDLGCQDAFRDLMDELGLPYNKKRKLYVEDVIAAMRAAIPGFAEWQDAQ